MDSLAASPDKGFCHEEAAKEPWEKLVLVPPEEDPRAMMVELRVRVFVVKFEIGPWAKDDKTSWPGVDIVVWLSFYSNGLFVRRRGHDPK